MHIYSWVLARIDTSQAETALHDQLLEMVKEIGLEALATYIWDFKPLCTMQYHAPKRCTQRHEMQPEYAHSGH